MSPRRPAAATDEVLPDGDDEIVRRAPFAESPVVGERGQRARTKILDAALQVFGEVGYHECGIKRITEVSGSSRTSFYQYFSSKEDVFRHLAGRVAQLLNESAAALDPITGDQAGWDSLDAWLERYSAIFDEYQAVFITFQTAVVSDTMVASGASVVATRTASQLRGKVVGSNLPPAQVDGVVRSLLQTVARLNRESELLELVAPDSGLDRSRVNRAYADVLHRALFGADPDVNVHTTRKKVTPIVDPAPVALDDDPSNHGPAAQLTRDQLLEAGREVFVERGYYATRVADIVREAGVSHGVFYRYFDNKTHLFRILAEQASDHLSQAMGSLPDLGGSGSAAGASELRSWLGRYADTFAAEAAIFTMWSEAISRDPDLTVASAALIDRTRARLAKELRPRRWGDPEAEGLVLLVLLDAMISHRGVRASRIEPVAQLIERGLLTGPDDASRTNGRTAPARRAAARPAKKKAAARR